MSDGCFIAGEAAQVTYEQLRTALLAGEALSQSLAWQRLERLGLAGLVEWRGGCGSFAGSVVGAQRERWSGAVDPRQDRLAEVYGFLLAAGEGATAVRRVAS